LAFGDVAGLHNAGKRNEGDFSLVNIGTNDRINRFAVDATWGPGAKVENRFRGGDAVNDASLTTGTTKATFSGQPAPGFYSGRASTDYYSFAQSNPEEARIPVPRLTEKPVGDVSSQFKFYV
jgi:hypothetical protein